MPSTRRRFLEGTATAALTLGIPLEHAAAAAPSASSADHSRMKALAAWTAASLQTANPVPFGAEVVKSATGESLLRALNEVHAENDPSAHAEVHTIRLACRKLGSSSLVGYTLYTTCEPCPMCMSDALWAGIDRVVFGATIADANRFVKQIRIPATEVVARSDMKCEVVGGVEREACLAIFTDPRMQVVFKRWAGQK